MESVQTINVVGNLKNKVVNVAFYDRTACAKEQNEKQFVEREAKLHNIASRKFGARGYCVTDYCYDNGYTGMTMSRPGLKKILADSKNSDWDYLVVASSDRLSRNLLDGVKILETLHSADKEIIYGNDRGNDPESELMESITETLADSQREILRKRLSRRFKATSL